MITLLLTNIKNILFIAVITALITTCFFYRSAFIKSEAKCAELAAQITTQNNQISVWKEQAAIEANKIKDEEEESVIKLKEAHKLSNSIMSEKVPVKCLKAMEWGIDEAVKFRSKR
jgi:hypothetical protein